MKVQENGLAIFIPDSKVTETFPDTPRYKHRFTINSESSNSKYMVSYDTGPGYWTCSCRGNIRHGACKHLKSLGLLTRQDVVTRRIK